MRGRRLLALLLPAAIATTVAVAVPWAQPAGAAGATPVLERRIIGYSVRHRPIIAYHLGNPHLKQVDLLLGQMHGNEHAGVRVADALVHGRVQLADVNLWVVPTMNPDGDAAHTRQNAHGVDLNRNWPQAWRHLGGQYYAGPKALSEPETRAMYAFLRTVRPHYVVSLHQPLYGVDSTDGARHDPAFRNRLAANLGYPIKAFNCFSACYGSMTPWYTDHRYGLGFTVEFGWSPSTWFLTKKAPGAIVRAMGGRFTTLTASNPRSSVTARAASRRARISGWAYDPDNWATHVRYRAYRDGRLVRTSAAWNVDPAANRGLGITGEHGFMFTDAVAPGRHTYCLVFTNVGAGTGNTRSCVTTAVPA